MATTNAQIHNWLAELVDIKAEIDKLNRRKHEIGKKLGPGTYRSEDIPLIKVVVGVGQNGWSISWKGLAEKLAGRKITTHDALTRGFRTQTFRKPTVSVQRDTAKRLNPDLVRS